MNNADLTKTQCELRWFRMVVSNSCLINITTALFIFLSDVSHFRVKGKVPLYHNLKVDKTNVTSQEKVCLICEQIIGTG